MSPAAPDKHLNFTIASLCYMEPLWGLMTSCCSLIVPLTSNLWCIDVILDAFPYFAYLGTNFSAPDLFLVWRREIPTHPQLLSCVTEAEHAGLTQHRPPHSGL